MVAAGQRHPASSMLHCLSPLLPTYLRLQAAYCRVEPTHRFFWQEVAARVGSRSASECFAKIFDAARSPAPGAKLHRSKIEVSSAFVLLCANKHPVQWAQSGVCTAELSTCCCC